MDGNDMTDIQVVPEYCFCRKPDNMDMLSCDFCDEWYHLTCLKLTPDLAKKLINETWACPRCDNEYMEEKYGKKIDIDIHSTVRHLKKVHENQVKKFKCDSCDFQTKVKFSLIRHIESKHLNQKPREKLFKCDK